MAENQSWDKKLSFSFLKYLYTSQKQRIFIYISKTENIYIHLKNRIFIYISKTKKCSKENILRKRKGGALSLSASEKYFFKSVLDLYLSLLIAWLWKYSYELGLRFV